MVRAHDSDGPRLPGITALAIASTAVGVCLAVVAVLLVQERVSMAWGAAWMAGTETWGPVAFVLAAILYAANGAGLFLRKNWARWLTIVLSAAGIAMLVPAISGAVAAVQPLPIARMGANIVARAAVLWYLTREDVRQSFS